jgi:hypothetical protein
MSAGFSAPGPTRFGYVYVGVQSRGKSRCELCASAIVHRYTFTYVSDSIPSIY